MKLFEIKCPCGGFIFGPREDGKAKGRWLGYDHCVDCRNKADADQQESHIDEGGEA